MDNVARAAAFLLCTPVGAPVVAVEVAVRYLIDEPVRNNSGRVTDVMEPFDHYMKTWMWPVHAPMWLARGLRRACIRAKNKKT